jgi:phosphohistidine phosphatase
MKTLYVVRHAKSSWDDTDLSDIDRPLNERGKRDAPRMGKRLKEKGIHPELLLSSPARRAFSTAKRIGEVLDYKKDNIKTEKKLYHASEDEILNVVRGLSDKSNSAMIFGHNPGLTDFVNELLDTKQFIDNIPTCGIVAFSFSGKSWAEASAQNAQFLFFDYPKNKDD